MLYKGGVILDDLRWDQCSPHYREVFVEQYACEEVKMCLLKVSDRT